MRRKNLFSILIALAIICAALAFYPTIEIQTGNKLIAFRYCDDVSEFEDEMSYNESCAYYAKRDISVYNYKFRKFLFFHVIEMEYIDGNYCDTQFLLEEDYIRNFLDNAEIKYNDNNLDIAALIEGKEAIVGNVRYTGNDYENAIYYVLDGEYEEMYVFQKGDLLIIQVGSPDECPKYIAYK